MGVRLTLWSLGAERLFRALCVLIAVISLMHIAGCTAERSAGELYLERLAGALDQDVPVSLDVLPPLTPFPRGATLAIDREEQKLGVLDLMDVHRCQLGPLVAARNGSMGRVRGVSQRFLYDVELLAGLELCVTNNEALLGLTRSRRAELPVSRFNALFAGKEWQEFATVPVRVAETDVDPKGISRTLAQLSLALESRVHAGEASMLEPNLGALRFSQALGLQRAIWQRQSVVLEAATQMLVKARVDNPGCRTGQPTEAGRIRRNLFEVYYAAGFQPRLARQGQPDRGWLLQLRQLVEGLVSDVSQHTQAQRVRDFHAQVLGADPNQEYGRWKSALTKHTEAWQWQLQACGLMPGRDRGRK